MKSLTSVYLRDIADQGYPTPGVYTAAASSAEPSSNQVTPPLLVRGRIHPPGAQQVLEASVLFTETDLSL